MIMESNYGLLIKIIGHVKLNFLKQVIIVVLERREFVAFSKK